MRPATIGTVTSSSGQIQSSLRSHVSLNALLSVLCGASVMLVGICYGALYQFQPLCSSVDGILLRVSCIFVADGAKNGQQGEDLLEVEPLVCRVRVMVLRPVWAYQRGA